MKVLLLQNVLNLGKAGDVVEVKPGFCRNYLVPRGLAQTLSKSALAQVEELKRVAIHRADRELDNARKIAGKLSGFTVQLKGKVGGKGSKLYGSVTTQQIASAIGNFLDMEIDKRKITLPEPIKTLGIHDYRIKLHTDVEVEGKVEVIKTGE